MDGDARELPRDGSDQSCAVCNCPEVAWLHPLAADRGAFRALGKGYTLSHFWALCEECEVPARRQDVAALFARRVQSAAPLDVADGAVETEELRAFVRADLGARQL